MNAANSNTQPILALLGARGNVILYHLGETNHCPSCGHAQWYVGRNVAQCVRCDAAVPLASPVSDELNPLLERSAA